MLPQLCACVASVVLSLYSVTCYCLHCTLLLCVAASCLKRIGLQELKHSSGVGGRKDILPIKNLSDETAPIAEAGVLVCRALQQALYAAVDYLRECEDMDMTEDDELA